MSFKIVAACSLLSLSLAACSATGPGPETIPPVSQSDADCGAAALTGYLGKNADDRTIADIQAGRRDAPLRVIKPGMAVTMDYRAERLNVEVDAAGKIKRLYCS